MRLFMLEEQVLRVDMVGMKWNDGELADKMFVKNMFLRCLSPIY
jgi:hypothetical protein